jgi:hypothetical protein
MGMALLVFPALQQQQENSMALLLLQSSRKTGKTKTKGYSGPWFSPSSSSRKTRANPLVGSASFPAALYSCQPFGYGSASFPLLRSRAAAGKPRAAAKAAVAEPTLWVWLC